MSLLAGLLRLSGKCKSAGVLRAFQRAGPKGRKEKEVSTSAISSGSSYLQTLLMQSNQDMQTLQTDLGSGNLAGAKTDFAAFQQNALNLFQNSKGQQISQYAAQTGTSQTTADLQALQSALSSGDVTSARKALAAFEQDVQNNLQSTHKHHRHHHHQEESTPAQNANNGTNATSSMGPATNSAMTLASLLSTYQAFNVSSAATIGTALSVTG
jgi:hypothetical protein